MSTDKAELAAVLDIGTNSIRMSVAQVFPDRRIELLEELQRGIRLGHDTFVIGSLRRQTMNAAIAILRDYRKVLDAYGVKNILAVATSAIREADNSDMFLDRIAAAADFRVEVIEPAEESRLTVSAVRHAVGRSFGLDRKKALIVEVGGGSALLTVSDRGRIASSASYPLGAIRLQELLSTFGETPDQAVRLLRDQISGTVRVIRKSLPLRAIEEYVVIGWDARFVAAQIGRPLRDSGLSTVSRDSLDLFITDCSRRGPDELARAHGLPFAHAETLVPALLVNQALAHAAGVQRLVVAGVSLRAGLLMDLANRIVGHRDEELAESVLQSARTIGAKYRYEESHAEEVAALATRLFDQLGNEHRLDPHHRLLLHAAALLHEIGSFISGRGHHKHGYYIIRNSEIFGLRATDREVVALTARYHRRAVPRSFHPEFAALPRSSKVLVARLAALLRVADALARGQFARTIHFQLERDGDELVLRVPGAAELSLERRSLEKKGDLFEDVFGMKVRLETG